MIKFTIIFIFLVINSFVFSISEEDKKIEELKQQIQLLNKQIKKLESDKLEKLKKSKHSPKVGLVLSGGGAKGFAHVGVLKVLEENNIKIDYITGSSMGAIIGALYSVGYTSSEIETLLVQMDWENQFKDSASQEDAPLDQKAFTKDYAASLRYDKEFNFSLPKSFRNSQTSYLALKKLLSSVEDIKDFDKLPIPLRIIATELDTGEAKAFKSGDLAKVITASMAIPTIFDPVKIDNKYYADALLSRNFPVQDALDLGADIIIGVDVGTSLKDRDDYNIISIIDQIVSIQSAASTPEQRSLSTILISPDISEYKTTDFYSVKEISEAGEVATREKLGEILSFPIGKPKQNVSDKNTDFVKIDKVIINSDSKSANHKDIVKDFFKNSVNKTIPLDDLHTSILKIYNLDFINKVYYTLDNDVLKLDLEETPTNLVGLGFNYQTDYGTTFSIGTDINRAGRYGSISSLEGNFGDYLGLKLNNFFYYGVSNKIGILLNLDYTESPFNLYSGSHKISEYINSNFAVKTGILTQYDNKLLISYGVSMNYSKLDREIGQIQAADLSYSISYGEVFLNLSWDRTNTSLYPTSGTKGNIQYNWGGNMGDDKLNYLTPGYLMEGYLPISKKLSLNSSIFGGSITGDDILPDKYIKLGGVNTTLDKREFSFAGYHFQQKLLKSLIGIKFGVQYEILDDLFILGKWNIATFEEPDLKKHDDIGNSSLWRDYYQGFKVGIGYSSIIGPIELSISRNDTNKEYLTQLSVGYNF
ncbi:patatin-like phospholipase family protein [Cetobacterium sp. 2A]|uniref:patatin-like phospholipase family protein n=1 Tax=Cetobacterium sp. 2A TaxID=2754723 RepID=UPI00163BD4C3|nr:patatin-like phospholipase family protein [Cetobacterium sp. 2A]MBC2856614.1 patatin-like phospholipase family protein [Cetobacterium sp. 2A]